MMAPNRVHLTTEPPEVGHRGVGEQGRKEAGPRLVIEQLGADPAADPEDQRVDVEQAGDQHQGQEAGHDQVLDRVHPEHLQGVELLADLLAPRSAVIAVPATPATTTAVTKGANSRTEAKTKKPPRRSRAPKRERKFAACRPGAPKPKATQLISIGNQQSCEGEEELADELGPVGVGGPKRREIVFAVRIIMSPTCSKSDLAGRRPCRLRF